MDLSLISKDFNPNLFSPFYVIRKGLLSAVIGFGKETNGGRLLDFGCGSKPYKSLFNVSDYVGLDYENPGHTHLNEEIDVFYDGGNLPFDSNSFDYVLCTEVFEHVFDLKEKLIEINRVLKPNGKLFVTCPFVWNEHEIPHDYARYTKFALTQMLDKTGFTILEFSKKGHFFESWIQIFFLYFSSETKGAKLSSIPFYKKIIVAFFNIIRVLLSKFPNNNSFYLSNALVAIKN